MIFVSDDKSFVQWVRDASNKIMSTAYIGLDDKNGQYVIVIEKEYAIIPSYSYIHDAQWIVQQMLNSIVEKRYEKGSSKGELA